VKAFAKLGISGIGGAELKGVTLRRKLERPQAGPNIGLIYLRVVTVNNGLKAPNYMRNLT